MTSENRKEAVALTYTGEDNAAPVIKAKGKGMVAEQIIQLANEHNVPIYEDKALVELLGQLDLNETIPEELYKAVAEVLAFIYRLDRKEQENN
ncbi:EscU/YscU/HrcU family type III secretion system export apparatus switch protein [Pallidibacillus pasinlerensis]|uniref:Type III secretion system protein n=1 Tax=Pallidibacillus pasinlerensis TaxID=2703818 RepID=A0ABW9ZYL4_9BACI|nr:EscU/YscU/HrcU family type III secretion system export apparatus switch protein [Pallidibacillus pasinlerensis]NCU16263.1 type III secretion system protein [Pallidibacillus pasinlerensis]